ncbi:MAG: SLC13 family permease [Pyrinomonadaceae bacterium]|nr:SLC13 family permease [Pyrinomonadaceae bacterium]
MERELIITFGILIISLILFLTDKVPPDLVALLVAVSLGVTGILTPQETFSGFSRSAVITIMAIFILAEALQKTGVTEQVGNILLKVGSKSELRLTFVVMIAGAFLSLFMNNIAAASVLLPAVSGAAKKASIPNSRLMMPLAFGTILGGMATLLTTSNIIISSLLHDKNIEGFSLLDFAPVGLPICIAGILYVVLIGRNFLAGDVNIERTSVPNKEEDQDLIETYHLGENLFRAKVPKNSILINRTLSESTLRENYGVSVIAIERKQKNLTGLTPDTKIKSDDILVLEGDEEDFRQRDTKPYMEYLPQFEWKESDFKSRAIEIVEAMLSPRSRLISETLRSSHFREKYGMTVLAIWRADQEIATDLADVQLAFGDALLLQGSKEKLSVLADDPDLILLMEKGDTEIIVPEKGRASLMIFVATLFLALIMPDLTGAIMLGGALAMVLTGILTTDQAYSSISWKSIFLIAGMLPMGLALTKTNSAGLVANEVVALLGSYGAMALLAGIIVITVLLSQAINGAVVATIIAPVAIQVAQQIGVNPRTFAMGVALATSMTFMTPLGHPVNVLVMSPGGYNFRDFMKIGFPLTIILFVVMMIFLPLFWRF